MNKVSSGGPRMSIVVPNYNHARFVENAIAAIDRQTMAPHEVVVVDDGSTDDSVPRLQALARDRPWLRLHRHPENRGVNAACNTGFGIVTGDFVLISAADDCLSPEMVERASAAVAAFPHAGMVFSDHAVMSMDGTATEIMPLALPQARRFFSGEDFVRLMQTNFFYFHVSSVWFKLALLRRLGGFPPEVRWHGDLLAAYAAAFEGGAVYVPGAVSYVRVYPTSYGAAGVRSSAQPDVLRAWLAATRRPGWERMRAALVAAAIFPEYSLRALRALQSDPSYLTPRLARRIARYVLWTKVAPFLGTGLRARLRGIRDSYQRGRWRAD
jgi:glycosyltransferase involved in cell wall biosynthesis